MPSRGVYKSLEALLWDIDIDFDIPVTRENYLYPLEYYNFSNPEAKCQFLKVEKHCGREHGEGFAVQTKDGQNALIGHCCALEKLELTKEQVDDLNLAQKEAKLNDRKNRVNSAVSQKAIYQEKISSLTKRFLEFETQLKKLKSLFGGLIVTCLTKKAQSGDNTVWCEYLVTKGEGNDREKKWYTHNIGHLQGLDIWIDDERKIKHSLNHLAHSLESLKKIDIPKPRDVEEAESIIKQMNDIPKLETQITRKQSSYRKFISENNLLLLPHLQKNRQLRAETLSKVYTLTGYKSTKRESEEINDFDSKLQRKLKASGLRFPD